MTPTAYPLYLARDLLEARMLRGAKIISIEPSPEIVRRPGMHAES